MANILSILKVTDLSFLWLLLGLGLAYAILLWRLGLFTPPALKATRSMARERDIGDFRPLPDKLAERSTLLRRFYNSINVGYMLQVAGQKTAPSAWTFRTLAFAIAISAFFFLADVLATATGSGNLPYVFGLLPGIVVGGLFYSLLRSAAIRRRSLIQTGLGDSFVVLAVLSYHQRMVITELLPMLARCQKDQMLWSLLKDENWRPLTDEYRTKMRMPAGNVGFAVQYELIGAAYEIPAFETLGRIMRRIFERGQSPVEVLTQEAARQGDELIAEARINVQKSRTNIFIPIALMLVPLFIMIGAPIGYDLLQVFTQH